MIVCGGIFFRNYLSGKESKITPHYPFISRRYAWEYDFSFSECSMSNFIYNIPGEFLVNKRAIFEKSLHWMASCVNMSLPLSIDFSFVVTIRVTFVFHVLSTVHLSLNVLIYFRFNLEILFLLSHLLLETLFRSILKLLWKH